MALAFKEEEEEKENFESGTRNEKTPKLHLTHGRCDKTFYARN
jgi:hypothetical protein